jgi:hypothetical protein
LGKSRLALWMAARQRHRLPRYPRPLPPRRKRRQLPRSQIRPHRPHPRRSPRPRPSRGHRQPRSRRHRMDKLAHRTHHRPHHRPPPPPAISHKGAAIHIPMRTTDAPPRPPKRTPRRDTFR